MNTIIKLAKQHYGSYSSVKKANTTLVALLAKKLQPMQYITLDITYYCKNKKKDKDNIAAGKKEIFDGLVQANVLSGDTWKQIDSWTERFKVDKKNPRIEIKLSEVE
jgi:Holliday junction resolvase RusA-like endonuclease